MASHDGTEPDRDRDGDDGDTVPPDVERLALALRRAIGRSPQTDEEADRRLLRAVAARLAPGLAPTPSALDAHLAAVLAEVATTGELADRADPRHRAWIEPVGRIYLCAPEDLPDDLTHRIGSDTVLQHLGDGVTNRARAAARVLGVSEGSVRVRREPVLLRAAAAALLARVERTEPTGVPVRWLVAAGAAALVLVLVVLVAVVGSGGDDREDAAEGGPTVPERPIPVVAGPPSVLGLRDGTLVAVADGSATPLGLDAVVEVDAHRRDDVVHVVAELETGRLVYGAVGPDPARWVDLGAGRRAPQVAVDRTGRPVVVAIEGADGHVVRVAVDDEGRPDGGWQPLAATGAADIDMATNGDGRLEVGGVATTGVAFNVWQTGAPGGWSNYSDPRAGEDGVRIQAVANLDGRLELFVERDDRSLWNTWQEAPGRSWRTGWDTRYLERLRDWRVTVGPEGRLVAVALTDDGVVLRRQIPVPQADGTTKLMWPPSTEIEELDPLGGPVPVALTAVAGDDGVEVVATGPGGTVAVPVGPDGPGAARPLVAERFDALVPVDG